MQLSTLSEWLNYIGSVHQTEIDLGLDRIREVALKLELLTPSCPVVIVGGTNGKGSVVAGLQAIYLAAGYRTGAFTSPYLFQHNEEVSVNGQFAADADFCDAFQKIEQARGPITLSPFEYHTLAALLIFKAANLDVMILEVGLGGRLDAVNIMDADVAVITSIGIDHVAWLGDTRDVIAIEKAGIFRKGKLAICGDANPPSTLFEQVEQIGADFYLQGRDFHFTETDSHWTWFRNHEPVLTLERNNLLSQNMSSVLMAITCLQTRLPVSEAAVHLGLKNITLPGRMQTILADNLEIYDVAHNPHAAHELAMRLRQTSRGGLTRAVFSMLADKDLVGTLHEMKKVIDEWYVAPLDCPRAASHAQLQDAFAQAGLKMKWFDSLTQARSAARENSSRADRIIVFGSFYVVSALLKQITPVL